MQNTHGKVISSLLLRYYRGPNHPMKLRIWGWIRKFANHSRLTIPYGSGGWITIDERDYIQNEILNKGYHEPEVWDTIDSLAKENEILWDVGAHIGTVSVRAVLDPRFKEVHAFEPHPGFSKILELNLSLNKGNCRIYKCALGDKDHEETLHIAVYPNLGGSTFNVDPRTSKHKGSFLVPCKKADTVVFSENVTPPTLMKLDVEQWEYNVFIGAKQIFEKCPPKAIIFEATINLKGEFEDPRIQSFLNGYGYKTLWIKRHDGKSWLRENFLAIK